jgi:hypothetical protein
VANSKIFSNVSPASIAIATCSITSRKAFGRGLARTGSATRVRIGLCVESNLCEAANR